MASSGGTTTSENQKDRFARWIEQLSCFNFDIQHRLGLKHGNADALSRRPYSQCKQSDHDSKSTENIISVEKLREWPKVNVVRDECPPAESDSPQSENLSNPANQEIATEDLILEAFSNQEKQSMQRGIQNLDMSWQCWTHIQTVPPGKM